MPGLLATIEIEALEALHADYGNVDRIGEAGFLVDPSAFSKPGSPLRRGER